METTRMDLLVVLDRSGSMAGMRKDHEGGLRSFVEDQKDLDGEVLFTLVQFDSQNPCEIMYDRTPIRDVGQIDLIPRGGTPLLDAMGGAMAHLSKHKDLGPVVCMVITDGEENASHEWTRDKIKARVAELEQANWTFLFLGANIDSFSEAASLGMAAAGTANFNNASHQAVASTYTASTNNLRSYRRAAASGVTGQSLSGTMSYDTTQRAAMMQDDVVTPVAVPDPAVLNTYKNIDLSKLRQQTTEKE